ncbi:MAG: HlyD family type I secretion periplasmic adaptor subunit [Rhodobacteraceae bacterium]|nr:HlyD family type I secretion periplasmic adaptor subunit [Paracoccaceae bacterium]
MTAHATDLLSPKTGLTFPARAGVLASLALLIAGLVLMKFTMISGAVIAPGVAVVPGKPKVIQSLEGGVVAEIFVKDDDVVRAGDVLLRLDPTLLRINLDIYQKRLAEVVARESRLQTEYLGQSEIDFSKMPNDLAPVELEAHFQGQREIFQARREVLKGREEQYRERVRQFENQIDGVMGQISSKQEQLSYIERELESLRDLTQKGLARQSQLLDLQRNQSALLGEISEHRSELARIRNSIRDTELEILLAEREFKEQVVTELRKATAEREEITLQIATIQKQLERIEIISPVDGIIHEMQVFTVGGVVPPESTILQVVPLRGGVDFELRVDPQSIDQVFVGQSANVKFPAFDLRNVPEIFGTIDSISPTSVVDKMTGETFYRVQVTVPPDQLELLGDVALIPGMPIEAFLRTADRSVLAYLTKPLVDQLKRAFRDD